MVTSSILAPSDMLLGILFGVMALTQVVCYALPQSVLARAGVVLSLGIGLILGRFSLTAPAFYGLLGFGGLCAGFVHTDRWQRFGLGVGAFCLGFALMKHWIPGVENWCFAPLIQFSPSSADWNFWINFDKLVVGFFVLLFMRQTILREAMGSKLSACLVPTLGLFLAHVLVIMTLCWGVGFVVFDPKIPSVSLVWLVNNLLFVSIPEEAFFRLFVQKSLSEWAQSKGFSWIWGLVAASTLFALFHAPAHPLYLCACGISGLFYGFIFQQTKRLETSIFLHFAVNTVHFFFFSYPFAR